MNPTEPYKHRYQTIFRPKTTTVPYLVPSESEDDSSSSTKEQHNFGFLQTLLFWGTEQKQVVVKPWRDVETRQSDDELVDFFQQEMVDLIQQAIRDIDAGNY